MPETVGGISPLIQHRGLGVSWFSLAHTVQSQDQIEGCYIHIWVESGGRFPPGLGDFVMNSGAGYFCQGLFLFVGVFPVPWGEGEKHSSGHPS